MESRAKKILNLALKKLNKNDNISIHTASSTSSWTPSGASSSTSPSSTHVNEILDTTPSFLEIPPLDVSADISQILNDIEAIQSDFNPPAATEDTDGPSHQRRKGAEQ